MLEKNEWSVCTDEELVLLYNKGRNEALAELLVRYSGWIEVRSREILGAEDREDARQELMIALVRAVSSFDAHANAAFKTYLSRCLDHALLNCLAFHQTKKAALYQSALSIDDPEEEILLEDPSLNPEDQLILKEQLQRTERYIENKLTALEQEVLIFFLSDFSYAEIAEKLDCSIKSVDNAMQRIRRKLRGIQPNGKHI